MRGERLHGKVLVLGDGITAFLAVIRSVGRSGLEVHVGWCALDCPSLSSRYVAKHHLLPRYEECDNWQTPLIELLQRERFELVIATNEQSVLPLQMAADVLTPHARIYLLEPNTADIAFDKTKSTRLAESLGLRVPKSCLVHGLESARQAAEEFGYPLVLKPQSSYDRANLARRREVMQFDEAAQLQTAWASCGEGEAFLAQEHFTGVGVGVELLAYEGRILTAFQHERLHEPPRGGAASYRRSVVLRPELLDAAAKLAAALRYTGVIMVEFLVDPRTHDWRFIEINARFWGSLPLAVAAGADFPRYLYEMLVLGRREFPQAYRTGLYARNLIGDLRWLKDKLRHRTAIGPSRFFSWTRTFAEMANPFLLRESWDTITWDDARPGLAEFSKYIRRAWRKRWLRFRTQRVGGSQAGAKQRVNLEAALRQTRSILFVCYGNICRSPFAAELTRRGLPSSITVRSTGLHPIRERRSPSTAVTTAREWDLALDRHRSTVVDEKMVHEADVILTFDESIHTKFLRRFPAAAARTHRLGALTNGDSIDVSDPYGGTAETFRNCYQRIASLVEVLRQRTAASQAVNVSNKKDRIGV